MKPSRAMRVVLFSIALLLTLGLGIVQAGPVQAQEVAGMPLVKFEGVVEARPAEKAGVWTIDGQEVTATETTLLVETEGSAKVGAQVVVIAKKVMEEEEETFEAILIRVKPTQASRVVYLAGLVDEYVAGQKLVLENGKTVLIDSGTQIEGDPDDPFVLIKARYNGSDYIALTIKFVGQPMHRVVEFDGTVNAIEDDEWTVGSRKVLVNDHTIIQGTIVVGDRVKVRAYKSDDGLVALLIKKAGASWWPKLERFSGVIGALPAAPYIGDWKVGDRTVTVTQFTQIRGVPAVGAKAHVTAWSFTTDSKCVAMEIKIEGDEGQSVTIVGTIKGLPEKGLWGTWVITEDSDEPAIVLADKEVLVLPGTGIDGLPEVGDHVKILAAERADGVLVAKRIELEGDDDDEEPFEGIHLMGKITEVKADYIVIRPVVPLGTIKIGLSDATVVNDGPLAVGKCVAVRAKSVGHQQYEAVEITVVDCPAFQVDGKSIGRTVD